MIKQVFFVALLIISLNRAFAKELVIAVTGDTNFIQSFQYVGTETFHPDGASKQGEWFSWAETTEYVEPFFKNSDLNFTNVETVVTDDFDKVLKGKRGNQFVFSSHINGFRHLIEAANMNMFSLANNHIYDYSQVGMDETLRSFDTLQGEYPEIVYSGLAPADRIDRPVVFDYEGVRIAFASVNGVGYFPAASEKPSQWDYRNNQYETLLDNMADTVADLKILSIHFGTEGRPNLDAGQARRFRMAVDRGDVDIVIGHHPHVVRPVEVYNDAVIFYSLGNFLMFGAANIDGKAHSKNFGGIGKVHLDISSGTSRIVALEMIPIRSMHKQPIPLDGLDGQKRIDALNNITQSNLPTNGVLFGVTDWGTGLSCYDPRRRTKAWNLCEGGSPLR